MLRLPRLLGTTYVSPWLLTSFLSPSTSLALQLLPVTASVCRPFSSVSSSRVPTFSVGYKPGMPLNITPPSPSTTSKVAVEEKHLQKPRAEIMTEKAKAQKEIQMDKPRLDRLKAAVKIMEATQVPTPATPATSSTGTTPSATSVATATASATAATATGTANAPATTASEDRRSKIARLKATIQAMTASATAAPPDTAAGDVTVTPAPTGTATATASTTVVAAAAATAAPLPTVSAAEAAAAQESAKQIDKKQLYAEITARLKEMKAKTKVDEQQKKDDKAAKDAREGVVVVDEPETLQMKAKRMWKTVKHVVVHTWLGFRLLATNTQIAYKYAKMLRDGEDLTRRERMLLMVTMTDLVRMVPFSLFIIIPGAELLLPIFLKIFPGLIPSTFDEEGDADKKIKVSIPEKFSSASKISNIAWKHITEDMRALEEMQVFAHQLSGEKVTAAQIIAAAPLVRGKLTLGKLTNLELTTICSHLQVNQLGSMQMLRRRIWAQLDKIHKDDVLIMYEGGADTLNRKELVQAVHTRGMRSYNLSEDKLRWQLNEWIAVSCNASVDLSLLLFVRPKVETLEQTLKNMGADMMLNILNLKQMPETTLINLSRMMAMTTTKEVVEMAKDQPEGSKANIHIADMYKELESLQLAEKLAREEEAKEKELEEKKKKEQAEKEEKDKQEAEAKKRLEEIDLAAVAQKAAVAPAPAAATATATATVSATTTATASVATPVTVTAATVGEESKKKVKKAAPIPLTPPPNLHKALLRLTDQQHAVSLTADGGPIAQEHCTAALIKKQLAHADVVAPATEPPHLRLAVQGLTDFAPEKKVETVAMPGGSSSKEGAQAEKGGKVVDVASPAATLTKGSNITPPVTATSGIPVVSGAIPLTRPPSLRKALKGLTDVKLQLSKSSKAPVETKVVEEAKK